MPPGHERAVRAVTPVIARVPALAGRALHHAPGTDQVAGERHHVLAVLIGQRLAHRRLGTGFGTGQGR